MADQNERCSLQGVLRNAGLKGLNHKPLSIYLCLYLSIHLSIFQSINPSIHLYLSICIYPSVYRYIYIYLQPNPQNLVPNPVFLNTPLPRISRAGEEQCADAPRRARI